MRGQQRHVRFGGRPAQCRTPASGIAIVHSPTPGTRVRSPPRDHGGPTGDQHALPVLPAGLRRHLHQVLILRASVVLVAGPCAARRGRFRRRLRRRRSRVLVLRSTPTRWSRRCRGPPRRRRRRRRRACAPRSTSTLAPATCDAVVVATERDRVGDEAVVAVGVELDGSRVSSAASSVGVVGVAGVRRGAVGRGGRRSRPRGASARPPPTSTASGPPWPPPPHRTAPARSGSPRRWRRRPAPDGGPAAGRGHVAASDRCPAGGRPARPAGGPRRRRGRHAGRRCCRRSRWPGFRPTAVRGDLLALHEEGVGCEHRTVAHRHAVVHEGTDAEGAAGTEDGAVGLERAVLLGVALDHAAGVERAVVADGGERPLGQEAAVVEDPAADPDTQQPPQHVLERGAVEQP